MFPCLLILIATLTKVRIVTILAVKLLTAKLVNINVKCFSFVT